MHINNGIVTYTPINNESSVVAPKQVPVLTIKNEIEGNKDNYSKYRKEGLTKENIIEIYQAADPEGDIESITAKINDLEIAQEKLSALKEDAASFPKPDMNFVTEKQALNDFDVDSLTTHLAVSPDIVKKIMNGTELNSSEMSDLAKSKLKNIEKYTREIADNNRPSLYNFDSVAQSKGVSRDTVEKVWNNEVDDKISSDDMRYEIMDAIMETEYKGEPNLEDLSTYDREDIASTLKISEDTLDKIITNLSSGQPIEEGIDEEAIEDLAQRRIEEVTSEIKNRIELIPEAKKLLEDTAQGEMGFKEDEYELIHFSHVSCCHAYSLGLEVAPENLDKVINRLTARDERRPIAVCFKDNEVGHTAVYDPRNEDDPMPWIQAVPGKKMGDTGLSPIFRISEDTLRSSYDNVLIYNPNKPEEKDQKQVAWNQYTENS